MLNVVKFFKVGKYLQLFNIIKKIFNRSQDDFIINKNRQNHYFNKIKIKSKIIQCSTFYLDLSV